MAESKNTESTETKKSTASKIQIVGPVETNSGSTILRFERDAESKPAIDLIPGQVLTVGGNGGDVTKAEAERLLNYPRWEIKEVNE